MKKKITMIDPPSGWMYGFPKVCTAKEGQNHSDWLVEQGYPKKIIDDFGDDFYCRYWIEEIEEIS